MKISTWILLVLTISCSNNSKAQSGEAENKPSSETSKQTIKISGVYPHLAVFSRPLKIQVIHNW